MTFRFYLYIAHLFCSSFLLITLSSIYNGFPFSWSTSFRIIGDKLILSLLKKKCHFTFVLQGYFGEYISGFIIIFSQDIENIVPLNASFHCYFQRSILSLLSFEGQLSSSAIKISFSMFCNLTIMVDTGLAVLTQFWRLFLFLLHYQSWKQTVSFFSPLG